LPIDRLDVSDDVYELVATEVARAELAARSISPAEVEQVPRNEHRIVRDPHAGGERGMRRLLIGETDRGRAQPAAAEGRLEHERKVASVLPSIAVDHALWRRCCLQAERR
jgi:hypothetical protein